MGIHGDALKVRIAAPPQHGRANAELCRLLAGAVGHSVVVIRGASSRRKTIHIDSGDLDGIAEALGYALG